jgi:hypothetical protein
VSIPLVMILMVAVALALAGPASAITGDEFLLRSGADVVALCSAPASDPLYTAAIHMCHGFGAGTYQTIVAMTRHEKVEPVLCAPQPVPSRNDVVARFLEWAKQNPQHMTDPAVETLGRFFLTTYPCRRPAQGGTR